jgi:hypothetical protein
MTSPPPTGFAGPLKGAPPVAWQSQFHGSHSDVHYGAMTRSQKGRA